MIPNNENRTFDRHDLKADVTFSFFNQESSYFAQTLNLGSGGMCFLTRRRLNPGTTVCIRLEKVHGAAAGACCTEGLRTITLGQVKWCSEVIRHETAEYAVGIRYFEPDY